MPSLHANQGLEPDENFMSCFTQNSVFVEHCMQNFFFHDSWKQRTLQEGLRTNGGQISFILRKELLKCMWKWLDLIFFQFYYLLFCIGERFYLFCFLSFVKLHFPLESVVVLYQLNQGSTLAVARWPGATRNWCRATIFSKNDMFGGPIWQPDFCRVQWKN